MTLGGKISYSGNQLSFLIHTEFFKLFFFKILFTYLTEERDSEREHKQGEWEREKQASHGARSPMQSSIPGP